MRSLLSAVGQSVLDLLFPPRCQACREFDAQPLCEKCRQSIRLIQPPFCERCGRPFDPLAQGAPICSPCRRGEFRFDGSRSVGVFEGNLREAIHALKYHQRTRLAQPLGEMLADGWARFADVTNGESVQMLVPVPLHVTRSRERGFNQSELLAKEVAQAHGFALNTTCLQRVRPTRPQIELKRTERAENVRGAFEVSDPSAVQGKVVLLVDDMFTTGATLNECSRALKRAGARRVYCLTLSRQRGD
jgi:ComF family protein